MQMPAVPLAGDCSQRWCSGKGGGRFHSFYQRGRNWRLKVSVKGPGESFLNLLFFKGVILSLFAHHLIRLCLENADD